MAACSSCAMQAIDVYSLALSLCVVVIAATSCSWHGRMEMLTRFRDPVALSNEALARLQFMWPALAKLVKGCLLDRFSAPAAGAGAGAAHDIDDVRWSARRALEHAVRDSSRPEFRTQVSVRLAALEQTQVLACALVLACGCHCDIHALQLLRYQHCVRGVRNGYRHLLTGRLL